MNEQKRRQRDPEQRLAKATRRGEPSSHRPELGPCLIYTGADNGNGYGQFRFNGRNGYAHRYAWERVHGPIPYGLTVDHLCRVRCCVEVTHMELVDAVTNFRRGKEAQGSCKYGHEWTPENTYWTNGIRQCRECRNRRATALPSKPRKRNPGDRRLRFDPAVVEAHVEDVLAYRITLAAAARAIGCSPKYLGARAWKAARMAALVRDGQCLRCGTEDAVLDVHHRHPRGSGGSRDPRIAYGLANLITLCRFCHDYIENRRTWSLRLGYLVRQGKSPATSPVWMPGREWCLLQDDGSVEPVRDLPEEIA